MVRNSDTLHLVGFLYFTIVSTIHIYFCTGGSTIVLLLEKGVVEWDEDLLINGRASLETLVRVGMGLGNGTRRG